jgi:hypothetical protein
VNNSEQFGSDHVRERRSPSRADTMGRPKAKAMALQSSRTATF